MYTGARCLLRGCNPYDTSQLQEQYLQAGGRTDEEQPWVYEVPIYPPSTLLVVSPLALFRYPVARVLWLLLNGCLFVIAAGLALSLCPRPHRWLATILVSLILATSGLLLALGQSSAFAISLLMIGSYFFLRGRHLHLGALLLLLSLAVKPQIGGLIVLYLLVRGIHRRYAAAAVIGALAVLLCAGMILKMNPSSANWTSQLSAKISVRLGADSGFVNDPRPTNLEALCDVNLQAVTAIFFTDAQEFNTAAYAVFLALLAVVIVSVLRTNAGPEAHLILIGSLAVLSLMPVYHRNYDARLLLITIPAVATVYLKRRLLGVFIGILTLLADVSVSSRVQVFLLRHAMWQSILSHKFLFVLLLRAAESGTTDSLLFVYGCDVLHSFSQHSGGWKFSHVVYWRWLTMCQGCTREAECSRATLGLERYRENSKPQIALADSSYR